MNEEPGDDARTGGTVAGQAAMVEGSAIEGVTVLETPTSVLDRGLGGVLDPVAALEGDSPLSAEEAAYIRAARAPNTLRGYRADWAPFTRWCRRTGVAPLPASPGAVSGYLVALAGEGKKVGTISRHLSAIRFAHHLRELPDPTSPARVVAVWEGIRRTHGAPPRKAAALTRPDLFDVVHACATTRCCWSGSSARCAAPSSPG